MLSKFEYDGKLNPNFRVGEFSLPIAKIEGVKEGKGAPILVHVSSAGVTRPGRPGIDLEKALPQTSSIHIAIYTYTIRRIPI